MGARILVADDDAKQADLLRRYLEREGHVVTVVHDGREAIDVARQRRPDLLLLDVMMPRVDGFDVCRVLAAESDVPIMLLTARAGEDDLLLGLDLGADDYITKPYSPRELVARVRTVLRRTAAHAANQSDEMVLAIKHIELARDRHEVRVHGELVACTAGEFRILDCLASRPGRVFTRARILEEAFGFDHDTLDRTVDVHVRNLRRKIEIDASDPTLILTVYGVGYKFADQCEP